MTREEARIELQAMKDTFEEYEPGGSRSQMALKVALTALRPVSREKVEKVWRSKWKHKKSPYDYKIFVCEHCGKQISIQGEPLIFCPACGAAQTDEAVQMVIERLEALKDD